MLTSLGRVFARHRSAALRSQSATRLLLDVLELRDAPAVLSAGTIRTFDPQPEPPGGILNPGTIRGFNPQPDPPVAGSIIRVV